MRAKFNDLRTRTKLLLLCSAFLIAVAVTTGGLIAEKLIAIHFTQTELLGAHYLLTMRAVYAAILVGGGESLSGTKGGLEPDKILADLQTAQSEANVSMDAADLEQSLLMTLNDLWSGNPSAPNIRMLVPKVLGNARALSIQTSTATILRILR